jgi:Helix-turn-helix domain
MDGFAARLAVLMARRGLGVRALARQVPCNHALISRYVNGHQVPTPGMAARLDALLGAGGELAALAAVPGRDGTRPSGMTGTIASAGTAAPVG